MSPSNKKYDFSGKVALVTGSSSGIGVGNAIQFAQYGARVVITGRNKENLQKIANLFNPDLLMKRVGYPVDIANLASFFASDDARNITGSIYVSDSGMMIKAPPVDRGEMEKQLNEVAK